MAISMVTYAYVEHVPKDRGGPLRPKLELRTMPAGIEEFFEEHVDNLIRRANRGVTPDATFKDPGLEKRFERLLRGSSSEFLLHAQDLVNDLIAHMDGRSKEGLFVALRRKAPQGAAVLKLDVHDEAAARLLENHDLVAVENLLDIPGELQKGAVYPDPRPDSDLIVGDRLAATSLYFLDAIGAYQITNEFRAAMAVLAKVGEYAPESVADVAEALMKGPATADDILSLHLEEDTALAVRADLDEEYDRRPVVKVDAAGQPLRATIVTPEVTIEASHKFVGSSVRIFRNNGGWHIDIDVATKPVLKPLIPGVFAE